MNPELAAAVKQMNEAAREAREVVIAAFKDFERALAPLRDDDQPK